MSKPKIRTPCSDARVVSVKHWREHLSILDEMIRPVVLRFNESHGLVTIRPKRSDEIRAIKERRGLPSNDQELVTTSGCLVKNPVKLNLVQEK